MPTCGTNTFGPGMSIEVDGNIEPRLSPPPRIAKERSATALDVWLNLPEIQGLVWP
jgi:hypothetical protein